MQLKVNNPEGAVLAQHTNSLARGITNPVRGWDCCELRGLAFEPSLYKADL